MRSLTNDRRSNRSKLIIDEESLPQEKFKRAQEILDEIPTSSEDDSEEEDLERGGDVGRRNTAIPIQLMQGFSKARSLRA